MAPRRGRSSQIVWRPGPVRAVCRLRPIDARACAAAYFLLVAGDETTSQLIAAALHRLTLMPAIGAARSPASRGARQPRTPRMR